MFAAILFAAALAPPPEATALRIADAFRAGDVRDLAGRIDLDKREEWMEVVDTIERTRRISIAHAAATADLVAPDRARVRLLIDGIGEEAGTPREPLALPNRWIVELQLGRGAWQIESAKTEERLTAEQLLAAKDDRERNAVLDSARNPRIVVRIACDLLGRRAGALEANEALGLFLEARAAAEGDLAAFAYAREKFARSLMFNHEPQRAVEEAKNALVIAEESGDCDVIAEALYGVGITAWITKDQPAALDAWSRGGTLVDAVRDPRIAIRCIYMSCYAGDRAGILANAERTERASRRYGWREGVIDAHFARAEVYRQTKQTEAAAGVYRNIASGSRSILNRPWERLAMLGLADSALAAGQYEVARKQLQTMMRDRHSYPGSIATSLGYVFFAERKYSDARKAFETARADAADSGDHGLAALVTLSIAEIDRRQGRLRQALADLNEAERQAATTESARSTGGFPEWAAAIVAGQTLHALGRIDEAKMRLGEAIDAVESMRSDASAGDAGLSRYFAELIQPYVDMIEILVAEGRVRAAVRLSERMKARWLSDALAAGGIDVSASMTDGERSAEKDLEREIERLNAVRSRSGESPAVRRDLEAARSRLAQFTGDLYVRHPELRGRRVDPAGDPLQNNAVGLDRGSVLLDYVVGERMTTLFVIHMHPLRVRAVAIPAGAETLERRIPRFARLIATRNGRYAPEAEALHRLLVAPAHIEDAKTVGIIPDGVLWKLPFQVIVRDSAIYYAPSMTALARANARRRDRRTARTRLLAIGDPRIPDTEREVRTIGAMYGPSSTTIPSDGATESRFKSMAPEYEVLHIAGHAYSDEAQPMFSSIILGGRGSEGNDGILEARELIEMKLHADLAVLSACATEHGGIVRGEGIVGLSWAFLVAGCRTIVASQWNVASSSTATLMIDFHRRLLRGETPPAALRHAALALRKNPRYSHPFYWAPFVVLGAPR